jgi:DNA-binding transcriptional MerR regulator
MAEVVAYSGMSRQTVHNYTSMGLLREADRTGGGHRLYDESVFQRLDDVAEMRKNGKSIKEIRRELAPKCQ